MPDRVPATTIGELDLHLSYVQASIRDVTESLSHMATRADIEDIKAQLASYATKSYVDEAVAKAVPSFAKRLGGALVFIVAAGAAVAGLFGAVVAFVHWIDRMPK